jgi:hypothetical protein
VSLKERSFNVFVASREHFIDMLNLNHIVADVESLRFLGNAQISIMNNTMKREGKNSDAELIIRSSKLVRGPLLARRKEIAKEFVRVGLSTYNIEDKFEVSDLTNRIEDLTKVRLDHAVIISNLEIFSTLGSVAHISDLTYKITETICIPKFEELTDPIWKKFELFVNSRYRDFDTYIDYKIKKVFNSILKTIAIQIVNEEDYIIDNLPFNNFKNLIEQETKDINLKWENKLC